MWVRIPYFQKIQLNCPYSYVSNHYNLLVSKKHRVKKIKLTNKTLRAVKVLYRLGVVSNFLIHHKPLIKISFTVFFYKNTSFFKKIQIISTPSKKFFISKEVILMTRKVFKSSIIILSTSKGLLSSNEAVLLGLGGKLVYIIN